MKRNYFSMLVAGLALTTSVGLSSCSGKPDDAKILADFNEKARKEAKLANVSATVNGGVLTLNGQCPDQDCREDAEEEAKEVKGVSSVVNNIMIMQAAPTTTAPVEVSGDGALQTGLRDATKDFPGVNATVTNGEVYLTGEIKRDKLADLMQSVNALNPKKVHNNLTVK